MADGWQSLDFFNIVPLALEAKRLLFIENELYGINK